MRLLKLVTLLLGFWIGVENAYTKEIYSVVKLTNMRVERTSDAGGDNLFFLITQARAEHKPQEERIPIYPLHWLSKQLAGTRNIVLWEGEIKEGESIKLVYSLIEQKFPPWDLDDLMIGSAELILSNHKGKLKKVWRVPNIEEKSEVEIQKLANPQRYIFKGAGSRYDVAFLVEQKKK